MKSTINQLISSALLLILIPVLNSCYKQNKCSVFCNVQNQTIENETLKFYLDKKEKPVRINGVYYAKYNLESKQYDTLSGYWGRELDTIFYISNLETMDKYPMMILNNKTKDRRAFYGTGLAMPIPYYIKVISGEFFDYDTVYTIEHETDEAFWKIDVNENVLLNVNRDTLEHKDKIEKRIYKLSLNNGILDYKVEKGIIRRTSLPYKYE